MAGETVKSEGVCLDIRPWSRTSHVVSWLTPAGVVVTVVKGAVRAKSQFLGQYDLNYTCDIIYYARAQGDAHALRECAPTSGRERLRADYRSLALAAYYRRICADLTPRGPEAEGWYGLLNESLDRAAEGEEGGGRVAQMVDFDLAVMGLSGISPDFSGYDRSAGWSEFSIETGRFGGNGGRFMRISRETAEYLNGRRDGIGPSTPLDAARVISVFYQFHLDCAFDVRRSVLSLISAKP